MQASTPGGRVLTVDDLAWRRKRGRARSTVARIGAGAGGETGLAPVLSLPLRRPEPPAAS